MLIIINMLNKFFNNTQTRGWKQSSQKNCLQSPDEWDDDESMGTELHRMNDEKLFVII